MAYRITVSWCTVVGREGGREGGGEGGRERGREGVVYSNRYLAETMLEAVRPTSS